MAIFTIFYNIIERLVSMWFGFQVETLTLFGFGVDSCWFVDRYCFQPDQPSQARNNFLGYCNFVNFDCRYGLADECKEESW